MRRLLFIIVIIVLSPIIVLAQSNKVEVSYNIQANVNFVDKPVVINEKVNNGEKLLEPSHQGKTGYIFLGWFNNGKRWDFENDIVTSHLSLTAKYKEENTIFIDKTNSNDSFLQPSISFDYNDITILDDDKQYLADGHNISIWLEIKDISDSIANSKKEEINKLARKDGLNVDYYLDIDLFKQIDGIDSTKEQIYSTNNKIKVSLTLPENMRKKNRKYHVISLHDGIAEKIYSGLPNENWKLEFDTDKFSSYAIAHVNSNIANGANPKTEDNINYYFRILIISYILLVSLIFWKKCEFERR